MRVLIVAVFLIAAAGCRNYSASSSVPGNVLPPATMQPLLRDLLRADQFVSGFVLPRDSTLRQTPEKIKWYNRVLQSHAVTEEQFKRSFRYYQDHPDLMAVMMDSIATQQETIDAKPRQKPTRLVE